MAVYIDETWEHGATDKMPYPRSCHMMADSQEELLAFARKLGLNPKWLHKDHFDIIPSKRAAALRLGACEMPTDIHEKVRLVVRLREQWKKNSEQS